MIRLFGHYIQRTFVLLGLIELLLLGFSMLAAQTVRLAIEGRFDPAALGQNFLPEATIYAGIFWLSMVSLGLYQRETANDLWMTFIRLLASFALGFVLLTILIYVFRDIGIWRSALAIAIPLSLLLLLASRWIFLRISHLDTFKRRILVIGIGKNAAKIAELARRESPSFVCVGFVALTDIAPEVPEEQVYRGVNSILDLAQNEKVDEIVVAPADRRAGLPMRDLLTCKSAGIRIVEYATFFERETGKVDLDALHPSWLIFSENFAASRPQQVLKRIFDITASLLLLVFSLPVLILTAIGIKLTSPGPVFYRQERVGRDGKTFMLLKFRSMRTDAESDGVPRWAAEKDSRVTRIGAFIRTTRIDEIPQIFNVLKGDMSFIGPRPERPFFVESLSMEIPYYEERHQVKPGISGWAQLNYPYGASVADAREKLSYDLYYIKNYSIFLDLIVLMQTVRVVIWPQGVR